MGEWGGVAAAAQWRRVPVHGARRRWRGGSKAACTGVLACARMRAAACRCGYPADWSGCSGRRLPPLLHAAGWIAARGSCPAGSRLATWMAGQCHQSVQCDLLPSALVPRRAVGPGHPHGRPALAVPAARARGPLPPRHSPKRRAGRPDGRIAPTVTHCVWLRLPPAPVSHRAVGSGRPPVPVPACARWASLHPPPARFLSRRHTGRGARSPPVSTCAPCVGSHPPPARFYSRLWPGRRVVFRAVTAGSGHSRRVALAANWTGELERAG